MPQALTMRMPKMPPRARRAATRQCGRTTSASMDQVINALVVNSIATKQVKHMFSFETSSGSLASWLEERSGVCRGGWAIGCRACRLAGFRDLWGRTRISGGTVGAWHLKRHDTSASHQRALAIVRQMGEDDPAEIAKLAVAEDREDVPSYALCFAAYKGALKGNAFTEYTEDVGYAATVGANVR